MDRYNARLMLEFVIERLSDNLIRYSNRKNASSEVTKKYRTVLAILDHLNENLDLLLLFEVWYEIESEILEMEKEDPELTHFIIYLRRNRTGDKPGFINKDLNDYEKE